MAGKVHIWWKPERYQCGRKPIRQDWRGPHVTQDEAGKATCLSCLRAQRRSSLWSVTTHAPIAQAVTEQIDKLTRAQARKRRKAVEAPDGE